MGSFLDRYCIPKLNQEQINNLNRHITPKEIEVVIKSLSTTTTTTNQTWPDGFSNPHQNSDTIIHRPGKKALYGIEKTRTVKVILYNKKFFRGLTVKLYYRAIVIKTAFRIGIKTDMWINEIELKTLTFIHTPIIT